MKGNICLRNRQVLGVADSDSYFLKVMKKGIKNLNIM